MSILDKVVLLQIDCETEYGSTLAQNFSIRGYPTFILTNAAGEPLYRWWGYEKEEFINELSTGLSDPTTISEKKERFESNPDYSTAEVLGEYHRTSGELKDAARYYEQAASLNPEKGYHFLLFQIYLRGVRDTTFSIDQMVDTGILALTSEEVTSDERGMMISRASDIIRRYPDHDRIRSFLKQAYDHVQSSPQDLPADAVAHLNASYYIYIENDPDRAVEIRKASMPEGWMDDAVQLNRFSWWCFENRVNLNEAERLAERAVKLAEKGPQKAMILDTQAEIVFVLGKTQEAVRLMTEAVQEDPDNEYYKKQLEKFKKAIPGG